MKPKSSVWRYFNKLIDKENLTAYTCRYCAARYKCAHATRLRDHLIKCAACPINVKALFNRKKRTQNVHLNHQTHQLMKQHQVIIYALFYYNFHVLGILSYFLYGCNNITSGPVQSKDIIRYYKPRCGEWPRSERKIYIEHHSFLGIEVLPSSQLSAVSMATRVSRSVF